MPLVGTNSEEETTKPAILKVLHDKYGIEEEDFASAELEIIPAQKSRDVGLDRSMIMSHGHDDRVCSYGNLAAILDAAPGAKTQAALFADKEEIGSVGNTGVHSSYFLDFIAELLALQGHVEEIWLRRAMRHSEVLSADVCAAFDPVFPDAYEEHNSAKLGYGICLCKYTGARGKSGSNDANAEFCLTYAVSSTKTMCPGRLANSAKSIRAAAAPLPISWQTGAVMSSTVASPCTACTRH